MGNRRKLHACTNVYNILNNNAPEYITSEINLVSDIHTYNTRQRSRIYVDTRRTAMGFKSFMSHAPLLFNALPSCITNLSNVNSFKSKYKNYLLSIQVQN